VAISIEFYRITYSPPLGALTLGLPTYPFNNAFGVASYEVFFGRVGAHVGETGFYFLHTVQGFFKASFLGCAKFFNVFL
jgi:hypothetical protein